MMSGPDGRMCQSQSTESIVSEWANVLTYPIPDRSALIAAVKEGVFPDLELSQRERLAELASRVPEGAFPIGSSEEFVRKGLQWGVVNPKGVAGIEPLCNMPRIGFSLRRRDGEAPAPGFGIPIELQQNEEMDDLNPAASIRPERDRMRRVLGPIGDIILDIAQQLTFPLRNADVLGRQFAPEEEIILDSRSYPLRALAAGLPDALFPLVSIDDVVEKIEQGEIREIRPAFLWSLLDGVRELGVRFRGSESCQGQGAQEFPMAFGGPGDAAAHEGAPPSWWQNGPGCSAEAEQLGPLGGMVLDLAGQIQFPVDNVGALAENFSDEDVLHMGEHQGQLKRILRRVPEKVFPLLSRDDLIEKLIAIDFGSLTVERLEQLLAEELTSAGTMP